ncbi:MAG: CopG family transcriptional regulator [Thermoleophilia bacterium]|nr:CopG family transcriptional regulator [Thermoleophilia bacterium]
MPRIRRIQVVIDPELDDRLEQEAAARGISKSALVGLCLVRELPAAPPDNGLLALLELSKRTAGVEPADIDSVLYGPLDVDR